jgi:hypothetical protein
MSLPPHDGNGTPPPPPAPDGPVPPAPDGAAEPQFTPPTAQIPPAPESPAAAPAGDAPQPEPTVPPAPPEPAYAAPGGAFPGAQPPAPDAQGYPAPSAPSVPPYAAAYPGAPVGPGAPTGPGAPYGGAPYSGVPIGAPKPAGKGLAITGLVLGILGFLGALIPFGIFGAGLLLLAAIVIGIIVLVRRRPGKGMGIAALILGGLGIILGIVITVNVTNWLVANSDELGSDIIQQSCDDAGLTEEECDAYLRGEEPSTGGDEPAGAAAAIEVGETAFGAYPGQDGMYWYTVEITNADDAAYYEFFYADVEAVDADGTILDTSSFGGTLLPGTTMYSGIFTEVGDAEIASLDVRGLEDQDASAPTDAQLGEFAFEGVTAETDEYSTTLTGTIKSTFAEDQDSVEITVVARDSDGKVVYADSGSTDRVPAGGGANFEIYLGEPLPDDLTYELYPHIW